MIRRWRQLYSDESAYLKELADQGRLPTCPTASTQVCIFHEGNFTTAMVKRGSVIKVGVAKRSPQDGYSPDIGDNIALVRALRSTRGVRI